MVLGEFFDRASEPLIILFRVGLIAWVARREFGDFARDNNVMCR
jgi:hypothetical protein